MGNKDVLRRRYPSDRQYLDFPGKEEGRKGLIAVARRRLCFGSLGILEKDAIFLIN